MQSMTVNLIQQKLLTDQLEDRKGVVNIHIYRNETELWFPVFFIKMSNKGDIAYSIRKQIEDAPRTWKSLDILVQWLGKTFSITETVVHVDAKRTLLRDEDNKLCKIE